MIFSIHRIWCHQFSVVCCFALNTTILPVSAEPVLVLEQKHYMTGLQKLFLTPSAVRLDQDINGLSLITRAPFKEIEVINANKRNYLVKKLAFAVPEMAKATQLVTAADPLEDEPWNKGVVTEYAGVKARMFTRTTPKKSVSKIWVLETPAYPRLVTDLISHGSNSLPLMNGMVMRLESLLSIADERADEYETLPRKATVVIKTLSAKTVDMPASIFVHPAGFACVSGTNKALPNTRTSRNREEMMANPDFMFQSGKKTFADRKH